MSASSYPHVFVAVQTTGLNEHNEELLELAIVAPDGSTILHTTFLPSNAAVLPELLGLTPGDLRPSPLFADKALQVLGHLTGPFVVGHNTQLAMRFINHNLRQVLIEEEDEEIVGEKLARIAPRFLDTVTLAWEQLPDLGYHSLEAVCHYLRVPYLPNHSALEDARAARIVYNMLLRATVWQRWWWKWKAPA